MEKPQWASLPHKQDVKPAVLLHSGPELGFDRLGVGRELRRKKSFKILKCAYAFI